MTQINEIIINFNSISIPIYLLYEQSVKNVENEDEDDEDENDTPLMCWLKNSRTGPIRNLLREPQSGIPEELKYSGWQTDKNNWDGTPLMFWICRRKNEPIPEELKYPGWQTDKSSGVTPLWGWIECRNNEPIPEELFYSGCKTDERCGETLLMVWVRCRKRESIPEELKYPGWQTRKNYLGLTPLIIQKCNGM
jgi:hypothetical protein